MSRKRPRDAGIEAEDRKVRSMAPHGERQRADSTRAPQASWIGGLISRGIKWLKKRTQRQPSSERPRGTRAETPASSGRFGVPLSPPSPERKAAAAEPPFKGSPGSKSPAAASPEVVGKENGSSDDKNTQVFEILSAIQRGKKRGFSREEINLYLREMRENMTSDPQRPAKRARLVRSPVQRAPLYATSPSFAIAAPRIAFRTASVPRRATPQNGTGARIRYLSPGAQPASKRSRRMSAAAGAGQRSTPPADVAMPASSSKAAQVILDTLDKQGSPLVDAKSYRVPAPRLGSGGLSKRPPQRANLDSRSTFRRRPQAETDESGAGQPTAATSEPAAPSPEDAEAGGDGNGGSFAFEVPSMENQGDDGGDDEKLRFPLVASKVDQSSIEPPKKSRKMTSRMGRAARAAAANPIAAKRVRTSETFAVPSDLSPDDNEQDGNAAKGLDENPNPLSDLTGPEPDATKEPSQPKAGKPESAGGGEDWAAGFGGFDEPQGAATAAPADALNIDFTAESAGPGAESTNAEKEKNCSVCGMGLDDVDHSSCKADDKPATTGGSGGGEEAGNGGLVGAGPNGGGGYAAGTENPFADVFGSADTTGAKPNDQAAAGQIDPLDVSASGNASEPAPAKAAAVDDIFGNGAGDGAALEAASVPGEGFSLDETGASGSGGAAGNDENPFSFGPEPSAPSKKQAESVDDAGTDANPFSIPAPKESGSGGQNTKPNAVTDAATAPSDDIFGKSSGSDIFQADSSGVGSNPAATDDIFGVGGGGGAGNSDAGDIFGSSGGAGTQGGGGGSGSQPNDIFGTKSNDGGVQQSSDYMFGSGSGEAGGNSGGTSDPFAFSQDTSGAGAGGTASNDYGSGGGGGASSSAFFDTNPSGNVFQSSGGFDAQMGAAQGDAFNMGSGGAFPSTSSGGGGGFDAGGLPSAGFSLGKKQKKRKYLKVKRRRSRPT